MTARGWIVLLSMVLTACGSSVDELDGAAPGDAAAADASAPSDAGGEMDAGQDGGGLDGAADASERGPDGSADHDAGLDGGADAALEDDGGAAPDASTPDGGDSRPIMVTQPSVDAALAGETITVSWSSVGVSEVLLTLDCGGARTLTHGPTSSGASGGTEAWTIPFDTDVLGTSCTVVVSDAGDPARTGSSPHFALGALMAIEGTATGQQVVRLDPMGSAPLVLASIDGLGAPLGGPVVDEAAGRIWAIHGLSMDPVRMDLLTIDARNGGVVGRVPLADAPSASEVTMLRHRTSDGRSIGFRWRWLDEASGIEEMVHIADDGAETVLGVVGDLMWWSGTSAYDPTVERIYVLGMPATGARRIYVMNARTGALVTVVPLTEPQVEGFFHRWEGDFLWSSWNAEGSVQELLRWSPGAEPTRLAVVGSLAVWEGLWTVHRRGREAILFGRAADESHHVYRIDLGSGAVLSRLSTRGPRWEPVVAY